MPSHGLAAKAHAKFDSHERLVVPLMGFPGVELAGSNIKLAQQNYGEHFRAIRLLVERFMPDLVFPLMDLSVEANAVGRYTIFPRDDSATVPKDHFHFGEIERLRNINISFDSRIASYVETVKMMRVGLPEQVLKGAYITGPYTLAALIMGADDAAMATLTDREQLHRLCELTTEKIQEYARLLIAAGTQLLCVLEPSAVMLSPDQFKEFSADYIGHINQSCRYSGVETVYHTCGNTMHLAPAMAAAGVSGVSLDSAEAGVNLRKVADLLPDNIAIIGNINPATIMLKGSPEAVRADVRRLKKEMADVPNFILSTGCDLPQETPMENIRAFMEEGRG